MRRNKGLGKREESKPEGISIAIQLRPAFFLLLHFLPYAHSIPISFATLMRLFQLTKGGREITSSGHHWRELGCKWEKYHLLYG